MTQHNAGGQRTLPLSVENMGFLLDRFGQDCAPLQFLRELTQNSIEAIGRNTDGAGQIVWDVDWNRYDLAGDGVYKLCIIDTGDGMTGPDMVRYINNLSASISGQSFEGNYGVGAKIAAATRNPAGLVYLSWKDGVGSMIHLWREPTEGVYGLRQFEHRDGTYNYYLPIEDDVKPELIGEHGTMVVLLGSAEDHHTVVPPEGTASPSRWIAKYLNTRYFELPEGVECRAREGWENPRTDKDRNLLRRITGQREYLEGHAQSSGSVALAGATAHWWILRDEDALSQNSGFANSNGHTAALYQGELYEIETSRSAVARLQQFGIIFGYNRVVIYLEPRINGKAGRITTNTARTQLLLEGNPLPWAEWAAEFRQQLPEEILQLIEEVAAGSRSRDHSEAIRERLRHIRDLFRLSRYKPTPLGDFLIDPDNPRLGGLAARGDLRRAAATPKKRSGGGGGRAGDVYAVFAAQKGQPAEEKETDDLPKAVWVSTAEGTREPGFLEDRAAKYLPEQNLLQINEDFRVFGDMVSRFCRFYKATPGARDVIREVVKEWFEQTLIEAVIGVQSLQGAREWSVQDIDAALSEEALTAAVMPRYHIDFSIKRSLGTKLGSLKRQAS